MDSGYWRKQPLFLIHAMYDSRMWAQLVATVTDPGLDACLGVGHRA